MAEVRIDWARVEHMLAGAGGLVDRDLRKRAARTVAAARAEAPGSMPSRIPEPVVEARGGGRSATIRSEHPATLFVVKGTRPHVIRPVRVRALRFTTGGRLVFARRVNHPGTVANDFLNRALRQAV